MRETKTRTAIRQSRGDRVFSVCNYVFLTLILLVVLYPLIYVLSASISDPVAVNSGRMWLFPVDITWEGYKRVLENSEIWIGYRNTILYTLFGTMYNLLLTLPCAYGLSVRDLPGRKFLLGIFMFTMYFGGGLVPTYFLIKRLGMINSPLAIILPGGISVMNMLIARTYFSTSIPDALKEAAYIDGCKPITCFIRIILPLSKPVIAILALYYAVGHWNAYFNAMIYLNDRKIFPLQLFLREILIQEKMSVEMAESVESDYIAHQQRIAEMVKYSTMIVSALPLLVVYPFLQRFFVQGVMIGSVKG